MTFSRPQNGRLKLQFLDACTTLSLRRAARSCLTSPPSIDGRLQVRMMCWNLYQQLCHCRSETPKHAPHEVEEQLLYIQQAFAQLQTINKLAKSNMARENASMPSNTLPSNVVADVTAAPSVKSVPKIVISGD